MSEYSLTLYGEADMAKIASKFTKKTFDHLPEEKQQLILTTATEEFAQKGYEKANINTIAEKAGISVGSLYKYFTSKEDLFLKAVHEGTVFLAKTLEPIIESNQSIIDKLSSIIKVIQTTSREHQSLIKLYNEMTSVGNTALAQRLSQEVETISSDAYTRILQEGQQRGEVRKDIDPRLCSFFMDNLFMSLQFSYVNGYYIQRFKTYAGEDILEQDEKVACEMIGFLQAALLI
ncbi:MAG TPA: TetR/AcrR family transcriptional regulator [Sphaerochaeta sp.]|nr:TetR/AcrR family transcriptional regulator [Sphaerochaeta sp.]